MTQYLYFILMVLIIACGENDEKEIVPAGTHKIIVLDGIEASNYTYLEVEENDSRYWIAVPRMPVDVDEVLYYSQSMEMKDFHSETLDRTFESVLFVEDVSREPITVQTKSPHGNMMQSPNSRISVKKEEGIKVDQIEGGKTIEQIHLEKESLAGNEVLVKGKVVKFNPEIMGRNWIHIQDGTGSEGTHDLLVTSKEKVTVGQIVVLKGTVAVNKDFGAGYFYNVLLENAVIK